MTVGLDSLPPDLEWLASTWDAQELISRVNEALRHLNDSTDSNEKLKTLLYRSRALAMIGDIPQSAALANEILSQNPPEWATAEALITLGICQSATKLDGAEEVFRQANAAARRANEGELVAMSLEYMSTFVHLARGRFSLAIATMDEAAEIGKNAPGKGWERAFINAYVAELTGDRVRLRRALDEFLPYIQPATFTAGLYYFLWASLSIDEGDFAKAEEYLNLAQRIASSTSVISLNVLNRIQFARFYRLSNRPAEGKSWAEDAVKQAGVAGNQLYIGQAEIELALAYIDIGEIESAEAILKQALARFDQYQAEFDAARTAFHLAVLYHQQDHPEKYSAWVDAARRMNKGGYEFILEQERPVAFPLLAFHQRSRDTESRQAAENLLDQLARLAPQRLRVTGLGGFVVWQGRQRIPDSAWSRRKAGDLFRYLLLRQFHSAAREEVIEDIWPDSSATAALDLFHQATSTLRHALEPDLPDKFPSRYLSVEGDRVQLILPPGSTIDFEQFERDMPEAIRSGSVDQLQRALRLYTGELYPMDRYNGWSASHRDLLADLYLRGLLALGEAYANRGMDYQALQCARKAIQLDTWNEDAVFLGMRALIRLHDIPHALGMYNDLQAILQRDLDILPRADLRELAESLRRGNYPAGPEGFD